MRDYFFQVVLFLAGAFIGIISQLWPESTLRRVVRVLAVMLIAVALVWAGYELAGWEAKQGAIVGTTPNNPTSAPVVALTNIPMPPTNTPMRAPPTDTPTSPYSMLTLVNPAYGATIVGEEKTEFSWKCDGDLQEEEEFDLRIWRREKSPSTFAIGFECSVLIDTPPDGFGDYMWQVALVRTDKDGNKSILSESRIWEFVWSDVTPTPTLTPTKTPTPTFTPTATPTPTCPYQADTDAETITRLIKAESQAALDKDISIVQAIFAGDATIERGDTGEQWTSPITYYKTLFEALDFAEATHYGIQPAGAGITETVAYFTSGSRITYGPPGETPVFQDNFPAPPATPSTTYGSEHWTLRRNSAGCWVITEFAFNSGHIPFPP